MEAKQIIRELKSTRKVFEHKVVHTGEVNVSVMIDEVIKFIEYQEHQAKIGRAVMKWLLQDTSNILSMRGLIIRTEQDLLEWAKGVE